VPPHGPDSRTFYFIFFRPKMISISPDVLFASRIQSRFFKEHSSTPYRPTTTLQHINIVVRSAIGLEAFSDEFENIRVENIEINLKTNDDFCTKHRYYKSDSQVSTQNKPTFLENRLVYRTHKYIAYQLYNIHPWCPLTLWQTTTRVTTDQQCLFETKGFVCSLNCVWVCMCVSYVYTYVVDHRTIEETAFV